MLPSRTPAGARLRVLYDFTGEHITSFNATNAALSQLRLSAKTVNLRFGYQARPSLGFTLDVANTFNEPPVCYIGYKDRM